jgi:hypothetical protein
MEHLPVQGLQDVVLQTEQRFHIVSTDPCPCLKIRNQISYSNRVKEEKKN